MFENLIKELKKLEKTTTISIDYKSDPEGYFDKECPSDNCQSKFKVLADDWESKFKDEAVWCPYCGYKSEAEDFLTTEQLKAMKDNDFAMIGNKIGSAMKKDAQSFNRSQPRNSFIKLSMKYTANYQHQVIKPIPALEELKQKITCPKCNARYSVIGSAFFCPCCGHNSVEVTFDNALKRIRDSLKNIEVIRKAVSEISKDEAVALVKSIIELDLSSCVVSFQSFCDSTYRDIAPPDLKLKFNAFQNLEIGSDYWKKIFNEGYQDWLTKNEYFTLNRMFQLRHLLQHREGFVDQMYIDKSNDKTYVVGQRIVVKKKDINELIIIVEKLVNIIKKKLSNKDSN